MNSGELIEGLRKLKPAPGPLLHLNGTSARMLRDGYETAARAVATAADALAAVEFNARDYYPEPGRWDEAQKRRQLAFVALDRVAKDIDEALASIARQERACKAPGAEQVDG